MSLINQMLKDLDARKQQGANPSTQEVEVVVCHAPQRSRTRTVVVVGVIALLSIGSGFWWFSSQRTVAKSQIVPVSQPQDRIEHVAPDTQPAAVIEPVVVDSPPAEEQGMPQVESFELQELSEPVVIPVLSDSGGSMVNSPLANSSVEQANEGNIERELMPRQAVALEPSPSISPVRMVTEPPSLAEQAQQLRVKGHTLIQQQRYRSGAQLLYQAIQLNHGSAQQWQDLVRASVQAGELSFAMDVAKHGYEAYPKDIVLRVYRARLIVETGDYLSALTALQAGEAPSVASSDYYALLASVLRQLNRFDEAAEHYALLTTTYPQRGEWWIGRAVCADQLGSSQQALAYYQQAITCQQLNPQLKQFASQQLTRLGKG